MTRYRYLLFSLFGLLLFSCASIGSPDGGRFDEEPPQVLYATPADHSLHADKKKISIWFNEYIKLENPNEKVTVSPPQIEAPNIRVDGKRIRIDLYDSLQANTTYTIDFGDAIEDNNEGNPMGLYTYSFSTGGAIDTMEVSGTVLNAEDLEPIKGIMVGLYPADTLLPDSIFRTSPLRRVGRTNGSGRFTIKGVAGGRYRAFALKDMDNDYRFSQKSEQLAFDTTTFVTRQRPDWRNDTVWVDSTTIDKIRMVPYTHYLPDDLILLAFLEGGQDRHLLKMDRPKPEQFTLYFTAPSDSLPIIEGLNFDSSTLYCEASEKRDTITYWIPDTNVAYLDTLHFHLSYLDTDSLGQLVMRTDSLQELSPKQTHARIEKERLKQAAEWQKDREKKMKKATEPLPYEENPYEHSYMDLTIKPGGTLDPNQNIDFLFGEPLARIDSTKLHFYQKIDSDLVPKPYVFLPDEANPRRCTLYAEWEPKATYTFLADSMAFVGILGNPAKPQKFDARVRSLDEFGTIFLTLQNLQLAEGEKAYVQLVVKGDRAQKTQPVEDGRVDFYYLKPGNYYLRLFIDRNDNGVWDTGSYDEQLQPEEVFYFPKPLPVRAKFDVKQSWDVRGIPRDQQKPKELIKQKADRTKKSARDRNKERDEKMRKERGKR